MTLRALTRLVARGEGERLEFKRRVPEGPRIAREVIALANSGGGRLLLGVADDGEIAGLQYAAEEAFAFRHATERYCSPPVEYESETVPLDARSAHDRRRDVMVITVPESSQKPHVLVDADHGPAPESEDGAPAEDDKGIAYVRVGEMSVEASPEAVALMEAGEDEPGVTFQYGEKEQLLMRYLEDYTRVTVGQFAKMAGIPKAEASQTLLTLTKADILQIQADREEDYFTLAMKEG